MERNRFNIYSGKEFLCRSMERCRIDRIIGVELRMGCDLACSYSYMESHKRDIRRHLVNNRRCNAGYMGDHTACLEQCRFIYHIGIAGYMGCCNYRLE